MSSSLGLSSRRKCAIAFLPIKPEFASRIVSGEKRFEFRKASFAAELSHVVIYASTPVKKIVGIAEVALVTTLSPTATWERSKAAAGISRRRFREYFSGRRQAHTIVFDSVVPLAKWICPKQVKPGFQVPQSFVYVDRSFLKTVMRKGGLG